MLDSRPIIKVTHFHLPFCLLRYASKITFSVFPAFSQIHASASKKANVSSIMARGGYKRDALAALVAQRRAKEQEVTRRIQSGVSKHTSTTPNPHRKRPRCGESSAKKRVVLQEVPAEQKQKQQQEQPNSPQERSAEKQATDEKEKKRQRKREKEKRQKLRRKQSREQARAQPLPKQPETAPPPRNRPLPLHFSGAAQIFSLTSAKKLVPAPTAQFQPTTLDKPSPLDQRGTSLLSDPFINHEDSPTALPHRSDTSPSLLSPHPTTSSTPSSPSHSPDTLYITPSRPRPLPPLELTLTPTSHPTLLTTASLLQILTSRIAHLNAHITAFTTLLAKAKAASHTSTSTPTRPPSGSPKAAKKAPRQIRALEKIVATSERHCNEVLVMELAMRDVVAEGAGEGELEGVLRKMESELRGMVKGYEGRMRVLLGRLSREVVRGVDAELAREGEIVGEPRRMGKLGFEHGVCGMLGGKRTS